MRGREGRERNLATLEFRVPVSLFPLTFAAAPEPSAEARRPSSCDRAGVPLALVPGFVLPCPAPRLMEALPPTGGPGGKHPPQTTADSAAAEERPAEQRLRPGQSRSPPGAGGELCEGQRPATQQPSAEEKQTAGESLRPAARHWGLARGPGRPQGKGRGAGSPVFSSGLHQGHDVTLGASFCPYGLRLLIYRIYRVGLLCNLSNLVSWPPVCPLLLPPRPLCTLQSLNCLPRRARACQIRKGRENT